MTIQVISTLSAFIIFAAYIISVIACFGIPSSISDSDYLLRKPWRYTFELVMFICGSALVIDAVYAYADVNALLLGGGIGIAMVGIFSEFKKNILHKILHYFSAAAGFTLSAASFILNDQPYATCAILGGGLLVYLSTRTNKLWWAELSLSLSLYAFLLYNIL